MKILVTGGAGFIGSHIVDKLLIIGHEVLAVDNLSTGKQENLETARQNFSTSKFNFKNLDICDQQHLLEEVKSFRPEIVLHLAAQTDVRKSVQDPVFDAQVNIIGTLSVLEACRLSGVKKIIFPSSGGTIYGDKEKDAPGFSEKDFQCPLSPYGIAKKVINDYLVSYEALYGLDFSILALSNVYGPRQDPFGEAGVVSIFASRLLNGQTCTIYGQGDQSRDFIYVQDVADAFIAAIDKGSGLLINIGSGKSISLNELYFAMAKIAKVDFDPLYEKPRPGELQHSLLKIDLAKKELDWQPCVPLDKGLSLVLEWIANLTK